MSVIDERIERGVAIFRRAGDDSALLGAALLAFHGAIERFLDGELANRPELGANERRLLTDGRLGWLTRANLAESHGLLTPEQRARALGATRACKPIMRGDPCPWTAAEVQSYGQLAAELCGRMELIGRIDQRAERARTTAARAAPPAWVVPQERRRLSPARIAITAVFLATLAAVAWTIYQQLDGPRMLRALGALPAPTAEPLPFTPEPSPTPAVARATISGLGGGPGWLHVSASFDSPTRAIRLADGMQVTLRDQQQVDAGGVRWQLVEAGGYEGWVPENNLDLKPKQ